MSQDRTLRRRQNATQAEGTDPVDPLGNENSAILDQAAQFRGAAQDSLAGIQRGTDAEEELENRRNRPAQ